MPSWPKTSGAKSATPVHPTQEPCRSCRIGTRALTRPPGLVCHSSFTQATGSRLAAMTIRLARITPSSGRHDTRAHRDRASRRALPETSPVEDEANPCCHWVSVLDETCQSSSRSTPTRGTCRAWVFRTRCSSTPAGRSERAADALRTPAAIRGDELFDLGVHRLVALEPVPSRGHDRFRHVGIW